jgi:RNase P subunit RPR2
VEAYCLKCRTQRAMSDPQEVTMKNGKPATMGKCPVCGTKMYRIGKKVS